MANTMIGVVREPYWELPQVRQCLRDLTKVIRQRQNLCVLTSAREEIDEITTTVIEALQKETDFCIERVDLIEIKGVVSISLGDYLCVNWPPGQPHTTAALAQAQNLPEILILENYGGLDFKRRTEILTFIEQWADICHRSIDKGIEMMTIVVVSRADSFPRIPRSDVSLAIRWWWGFPSSLEVSLICRYLAKLNGENGIALSWKENIVSSLSGGDAIFAAYLWTALDKGTRNLELVLNEYAIRQGWSANALKEYSSGFQELKSKRDVILEKPPVNLIHLWSSGLISWTVEAGIEIHSAALAAMGRRDDWMHRVWRGQARLLLPILDSIRLEVCRYLTKKYGHDWPYRIAEPLDDEQREKVRRSPLSCEWGHLEYLLDKIYQFRDDANLVPLVHTGRTIRNTLAHYETIEFVTFQSFHNHCTKCFGY